VLRAYAVASLPALVMLVGAIALLEINYRRATEPEAGARVTLFGIPLDTATPWPWLTAIVLIIGGFYAFRKSWPLVAEAWQHAGDEARGRDGGSP
jgi:hypothetical protein